MDFESGKFIDMVYGRVVLERLVAVIDKKDIRFITFQWMCRVALLALLRCCFLKRKYVLVVFILSQPS